MLEDKGESGKANNKNGQVSTLTDCVFKTYFKVSSGRQVLECDK